MPKYYEEWRALEVKLSEELNELIYKVKHERTRENLEALRKVVDKLRKVRKTISEMEG